MEPGDSLMKYMSFSGSGILPKDIGNADVKMLRDSLLSMAGVEFVSESSAAPVLDSCYSIIDRKVSLDDGCSNSTSSLSITLANPRQLYGNASDTSICIMRPMGYMAHHILTTV